MNSFYSTSNLYAAARGVQTVASVQRRRSLAALTGGLPTPTPRQTIQSTSPFDIAPRIGPGASVTQQSVMAASAAEAPSGGGGLKPLYYKGQQALDEALPFVSRYAETFDVLAPNLHNQEKLRLTRLPRQEGVYSTAARYCGEFQTPLAAQPPGTGKTALGRNITVVLNRPREAPDSPEEAAVAARLRSAWYWRGGPAPAVEAALADKTSPDNLVVRTLMAAFPNHVETVLQFKAVTPLLIEMKGLVEPKVFGNSLDAALAYAVFCEAHGLDGRRALTLDMFLAQRLTQQSADGFVSELIQRSGKPLLLVLDDITDLDDPKFEGYATKGKQTPLHGMMSTLNLSLQLLHGVPGCFVYCTGWSLPLSALVKAGIWSPLAVEPILLQPLTAADVELALCTAVGPGDKTLLEAKHVHPSAV